MSTETIALERLARMDRPSEGDVQAGIDAAMRGVIADARHNPNRVDAPVKVEVASAVRVTRGAPLVGRGTGWVEPLPLVKPASYADRVIGEAIDRALGPAVGPKAREGGG
jgi:hypothetical protein